MNFLAHAIFADTRRDVLFGSIAGDFVGKMDKKLVPREIRDGLKLHNDLDVFFDNLEFSKSRKSLREAVNHYQSPVLDICCDHVFVSQWKLLFKNRVENYVPGIYSLLMDKHNILPVNGQNMMSGLVREDWFTTYGTKEGLEKALNRMSTRAMRGEIIRDGIDEIFKTIPIIQDELLTIVPMIRKHTQDYMNELGYESEGRVCWKERI